MEKFWSLLSVQLCSKCLKFLRNPASVGQLLRFTGLYEEVRLM